jgi:outer membrane protein insertion porin family
VGNKNLPDQELLQAARLQPRDPNDPALVRRGAQAIRQLYDSEGYFLSQVEVDWEQLDESGILIYIIREGPFVRVRGIEFSGNESFPDRLLKAQTETRLRWLPFLKTSLSRDRLETDAAKLRQFYQDRGYLDAQVGRRIELSDDQRNAVIRFLIDEGPRYHVNRIEVNGNAVFPLEQILQSLPLKAGDIYSERKQRNSAEAIRALYGKLGYMETQVRLQRLFHEEAPLVDVRIDIKEGVATRVGTVVVRGNKLTKQKVILREVRGMDPGRRYRRSGVEQTERRLRESRLFSEGQVTLLGEPGDEQRDALIEVEERPSGRISFGAAISSDVGLFGALSFSQSNFDIADPPESLSELASGRAFRGAGQSFSIDLQPGNEQSLYRVSFREPHLFDSDVFFSSRFSYFDRERNDFDEERLTLGFSLGQRFGDVWSASIGPRLELVNIEDIDSDAAVDVFDVEGQSELTALNFEITRNTTDSFLFPTSGNRITFGLERAGLLGGDFEFTRLAGEYTQFFTLSRDVFDRKTVLSFQLRSEYIVEPNNAPLFERLFAGGHRTFRGFAFRGVGPRGLVRRTTDTGEVFFERGDDPVGGDFLFLARVEYNFPLVEDSLRGVLFVDSGTVARNVSFENYRVSIGTGIRLKIDLLTQVPLALDLGIPLVTGPNDDERLLSFDFALPF